MKTKGRALVVGAGIAGPVAAVGLGRVGFEPVVFEAFPERASLGAGAWLTLAVNGLEALRVFELHEGLLDVAFASTTIELVNGDGKFLGVAPLGGVLPDGTTTQTLKRSDLYRSLADASRRQGVRFVHGKRLVSAEPRGEGVVARFDDGSEEAGALLVGADGAHSTVRTEIDPAAPRPRETNMGNVGGFVPAGSGVDVSSKKIPGPLGRFVRDLFLPVFLSRAARTPRDWLFNHRIAWNDPAAAARASAA
jgi:2-polyprenyl-6-methoxyphenol hydroxylase-like FAD-dependent oxidoreductase